MDLFLRDDDHMRYQIVFLLGIFSSIVINLPIPGMVVTLGIPQPGTTSYMDFPPIEIDGNEDLLNQAKLYGWPGLGTEDNPIVISKLKISGTTSTFLMAFKIITLHLKIEDCILTNGIHGLVIGSASENIIVDQLQVENMTEFGIGIFGVTSVPTKNIIVRNSVITHTDNTGIYITISNQVRIENNTICDSIIGIDLRNSCTNVTIVQNTITMNSAGVHLENGKQNTILNNLFINNFNIENNSRNLGILGATQNNIFLNNFYNASEDHIRDNGATNTFGFNYYNEPSYPINDADDDGFNDNVFTIYGDAGSTDSWPLLAPATAIVELLSPPRITSSLGDSNCSGIYTINWQQSLNSLQKNITYDISYSPNSGASWTLLATDLTQPEYAWNTTLVENSDTYKLKIVAKSSTKTCSVVSSEFTVYNEPSTDSTDSKTTGMEILMGLFVLLFLTFSVRRNRNRSSDN